MTIAQIGPFTTLAEAAATAVGAGVVLGSVASGVRGLLSKRPNQEVENQALFGGYVGGVAGAALLVIDLALRYGV
jgi:hypothetical protein